MSEVRINGEVRVVKSERISDLPAELGVAPETLLIELNGVALVRSEWSVTRVSDGDAIEVLRVAAGG